MALRVKDSGLRLRVERDLRDDFVAACRADGRTAADVLREYMRRIVERARAGQQDLFVGKGRAPVVSPRVDGLRPLTQRVRDRSSGGRERQ